MKKWVLLGIGGAILLVAGYLLFSFYTVTLMGSQLQRGFGPGMSIGKMEVRVTHLSVREIRLEDPGSKRRILQIEEVKIYPSLMALFKGIWKIQEVLLVKPVFQFSRSRDGSWMGPFPHKAEEGDKGTDESRRKEKDGFNLEIGKVRVEDGAVEFEDHPDGKQPVQIRLTHLEFRIKDIRYPVPSRSSAFELKGKVKGMTGEGEHQH